MPLKDIETNNEGDDINLRDANDESNRDKSGDDLKDNEKVPPFESRLENQESTAQQDEPNLLDLIMQDIEADANTST